MGVGSLSGLWSIAGLWSTTREVSGEPHFTARFEQKRMECGECDTSCGRWRCLMMDGNLECRELSVRQRAECGRAESLNSGFRHGCPTHHKIWLATHDAGKAGVANNEEENNGPRPIHINRPDSAFPRVSSAVAPIDSLVLALWLVWPGNVWPGRRTMICVASIRCLSWAMREHREGGGRGSVRRNGGLGPVVHETREGYPGKEEEGGRGGGRGRGGQSTTLVEERRCPPRTRNQPKALWEGSGGSVTDPLFLW